MLLNLAGVALSADGLDAATKALVQAGAESIEKTVLEVIAIVAGVAFSLVIATGAVDFALKKIKGLFKKVSS